MVFASPRWLLQTGLLYLDLDLEPRLDHEDLDLTCVPVGAPRSAQPCGIHAGPRSFQNSPHHAAPPWGDHASYQAPPRPSPAACRPQPAACPRPPKGTTAHLPDTKAKPVSSPTQPHPQRPQGGGHPSHARVRGRLEHTTPATGSPNLTAPPSPPWANEAGGRAPPAALAAQPNRAPHRLRGPMEPAARQPCPRRPQAAARKRPAGTRGHHRLPPWLPPPPPAVPAAPAAPRDPEAAPDLSKPRPRRHQRRQQRQQQRQRT